MIELSKLTPAADAIAENGVSTTSRLVELRRRVRAAVEAAPAGNARERLLEEWTTIVDSLVYSLERAPVSQPYVLAFAVQAEYARLKLKALGNPPQLLREIITSLDWQDNTLFQSSDSPVNGSSSVREVASVAPASAPAAATEESQVAVALAGRSKARMFGMFVVGLLVGLAAGLGLAH